MKIIRIPIKIECDRCGKIFTKRITEENRLKGKYTKNCQECWDKCFNGGKDGK
jgi:hypothetical protein